MSDHGAKSPYTDNVDTNAEQGFFGQLFGFEDENDPDFSMEIKDGMRVHKVSKK